MICSHCHTENPPAARFCLGCGAPLPLRCPACQAELPRGARFCINCGQPVGATSQDDEALHRRLANAVPARLADQVRAAAHLAGEQRPVTVLFADVVSSTALAEQLGAEAWMSVMQGAFERITPAIYHYEGTLARLVGDGLWAFFGAPVAHEDDPVRAVRAALDLLAEVESYATTVRREHGVEFAMRACINTGVVAIGPVGDDLRYEYTAVGGTVNLAARLKFVARPGEVLIAEETRRRVAPLFDLLDRGSIEVAGWPQPVHVYQATGRKAQPGRVRGLAGLESQMVGRDAELALLLRLSNAVQAGLGRAVLVVGEPGLGKTRLIAEWQASVQKAVHGPPPYWFEGHCLSYGQGLAYHLVIGLLRTILAEPEAAGEAEARAALVGLVGRLFGQGTETYLQVYPYLAQLLRLKLEGDALERVQRLDPVALQNHALEALRKLLSALAAERPVVLVLEDLHWADPSSTEIFARLLPLTSASRLLFCLTSRPERESAGWKLVMAAREALGGSLAELGLAPLSESDSRLMVSNLLRVETLPEKMRLAILRKAEGNPFFVEEVLRMLIDRGAIVRRNGDWVAAADVPESEIPDNLQGLLLARIDGLADAAKHTLRVAAVIGRQFPVRVLQQVLEGEAAP